jgi:hypothetical protein
MQQLSIERITKFNLFKTNDIRKDLSTHLPYVCINHWKYEMVNDNSFSLNGQIAHDYMIKNNMHIEDTALTSLMKDHYYTRSMHHMQKYYRTNAFINYVPSKNFLDCLKNINVNVDLSILDRDFDYYFEINSNLFDTDNMAVRFILASSYVLLNKRWLILTICDKDYSFRHVYIPINSGSTFEERFNLLDSFVTAGDNSLLMDSVKYTENTTIRTAVNLILYVLNPTEDFKEQYNKFAGSSNAIKTQKKIYTSSAFVSIGFEAEFLRLQRESETIVGSFFRWYHTGVGRLIPKLILVKPYVRITKSFED